MDIQLKKGMLDACVLAVLKREDSYGYKLIQEISAVMEISESTLYPVLRRLEAIESLATYTQEYGGRLRKYYKLTEQGKAKLDDFKKEWLDVKKVVDYILEEGSVNEQN